MSSTFYEFRVKINENHCDILTLSGTRLRDNKYLLDNVKIPGYNFVAKMEKRNLVVE